MNHHGHLFSGALGLYKSQFNAGHLWCHLCLRWVGELDEDVCTGMVMEACPSKLTL